MDEKKSVPVEGLALLQKNYLKKLGIQVKELHRLREILTKGFLPVKDIQQLYRTTHNFSGSGATFGFPDISRTARDFHEALKIFLDSADDRRMSVQVSAELSQKLEDFENACRAAIHNKSTMKIEAHAALNRATPVPSKNKTIGIYTRKKNQADSLIKELQHFGYNALLSHDLGVLKAPHIYDAVIIYSDLQAQELAGIKAASLVAPVILITTHQDFESRLTSVRAGVESYFTSDADVLKIIDKIESFAARNAPTYAWNVLIIDDDEMLAEFYAHSLQEAGMHTSILSKPKDCLKVLANQAVDLVLIDYTMPHCDGREVATIIRQHPQYVTLPIIFMSAEENIEARLINAGLGIEDYLVKPFTTQQLADTVSSRARRAQELKGFMVCDSFTGLLNHAHFLERLSSMVMEVQRDSHRKICYASIDIDHFKKINDTYGHAAGDQVLKSLARMLQQQLRRSDIIGRCGGEEFGIVMPNCDLDNGCRIMEKLREKFAESPFTIGRHKIRVTFSGGIGLIQPDMGVDKLISMVDGALYKAKQNGRNQIILAGNA